MKKSLQNILVLLYICAVVSVLLAATNAVTAPLIEKNEREKTTAALMEVMPDGKSFEKLDINAYALPAAVTEAYRSETGGYVLKLKTSGHNTGLVILCGIQADGTISGSVCLASQETFGYEYTYGSAFTGKNAETAVEVDTIAGATKTTNAYRLAVIDALRAAEILRGADLTKGGAEN